MSAQSISINLLPGGKDGKRYGGKFLQWALTYGRYIIIFTELIVLIAFFSRFKFDQELSDLHEIIQQKQAVISSVAEFETEVHLLQARIAQIKTIDRNHELYPKTLHLLDDLLPDDVVLKRLSFEGARVSLSALGYSAGGVKTFLERLRNDKQFKHIDLHSIGVPADRNGALVFDLSMDLAEK